MTTKDHILQTADALIRNRGYNAFSFVDIADIVGIKKPSVYHHFPRKVDLGVAVIQSHLEKLNKVRKELGAKSPIKQLDKFLSIYSDIKHENKVCLVGSLSTDYHTLDIEIQQKLKEFSEAMLDWVSSFLENGRNSNLFHFDEAPRTRAILTLSTMIAIVQFSRLTSNEDFNLIKNTIKKQLLQ